MDTLTGRALLVCIVACAAALACGSAWRVLAFAHPAQAPQPGSAGAGSIAVLNSRPLKLKGLPQDAEHLVISGRYLLATTSGSRNIGVYVVDLTTAKTVLTIGSAFSPVFVLDGKGVAYGSTWDSEHPKLCYRTLPAGPERNVELPFVKTSNDSGEPLPYPIAWDSRAGELLFSYSAFNDPSPIFAANLRTGKMRRRGGIGNLLSPDLSRVAYVRKLRAPGALYDAEVVHVSDLDGRHDRPLLTGYPIDWLDAHRTLLISRPGAQRTDYYRLDTTSGETTYIGPAEGNQPLVSPSRRLMLETNQDGARIISTGSGSSASAGWRGISGAGWGRTDRELYVCRNGGWSAVTVDLPRTGGSPTAPGHEKIALALAPRTPWNWRDVSADSRGWTVFASSGYVESVARVDGKLWLATSSGVKVLDPATGQVTVPAWARGMAGWRVQSILPEGDHVWLSAWRTSAYNTLNNYYQGMLARFDRRSQRVEVTATRSGPPNESEAFGALLATKPHLAVNALRYWYVHLWDENGATQLRTGGGQPADAIQARCAAIDSDGDAWLGRFNGLMRWKPGEKTGTMWTAQQGLPANEILGVAAEGQRILVGTAMGLSQIDRRSEHVSRAVQVGPDEPVTQMVSTRDVIYCLTPRRLRAVSRATDRWSMLPKPAIGRLRLLSDGDSLYAAGATADGLWQLNHGSWRQILRPPANEIGSNMVTAVAWAGGDLWCGHIGSVSRYSARDGAWRHYPMPASDSQVVQIVPHGGHAFVATWRDGAVEIDPATGKTKRWRDPGHLDEYGQNRTDIVIEQIAVDDRFLSA